MKIIDYRLKIKEEANSGPSTIYHLPSTVQKGFVSIFSVMVIMAILTLVAVGFSNVTRRAQRRTLDNQLNTQAFYAAESGVNDARAAIEAHPSLSQKVCQDTSSPAASYFHYNLDSTLGVGYTCLLIDANPDDLQFSTVPIEGSASPKVIPFESSNSDNIKSFDVVWDTSSAIVGGVSIPSSTNLPTSSVWGTRLGIVRIDLAPTGGSLARNNITDNSYTFFLYPSTAGSGNAFTVDTGSTNQGGVLNVTCSVAPCKATITLGGTSRDKYVMRLQALYNTVKVTVNNVKNSSGTGLSLQNAQVIVDVTGKASDVFRRIQVRLPFASSGFRPSLALQSADTICKRLLGSPDGSSVDTSGMDATSSAGVCAINN